jgi:hypothetical protein
MSDQRDVDVIGIPHASVGRGASTSGESHRRPSWSDILLCWDFTIGLLISIFFAIFFYIKNAPNSKIIFNSLISMNAIVFSLFFAVLAAIATSSSDDFLRYIESRNNVYTKMILSLRWTLFVLVVASAAALVGFVVPIRPPSLWFETAATSFILFLSVYGFFAAANCSFEMLHFANNRIRFLMRQNSEKSKIENESNEES